MRDRRWMLNVLRLMFGGRATLRRNRRWFWRGSVKIIRQSGLHSRISGRKAYGVQDNRDFLLSAPLRGRCSSVPLEINSDNALTYTDLQSGRRDNRLALP